jgi:hypothetical protein
MANDPTDVIIVAASVMAGSTIVRHIAEKPKDAGGYAKPIAYGFFLALSLLLLAVPLPRFARGLAYLGIVGALTVNGPTIYKLVQNA